MSADDSDKGLIGKITNVKHDFVGITVSGIVCKAFHTHRVTTSHSRPRRQQNMFYTETLSAKVMEITANQNSQYGTKVSE